MPKVSVIVPCYNVAPYVGTCLDSLVNQTLRDIEIICVDDKSTDNTLEIIQERARTDTRIKVIAQPTNSGVSVARNTGIDASTGEYISFVDADDYVDFNFFELLYNKAFVENLDICVSNICEHMCDGTYRKHDNYVNRIAKGRMFFNYIQCAAIFNLDFIRKNNIRIPIGITNGEDTVFCIKCAVFAKKIDRIKNVFYHYVRRADSAEQMFYSEKQVESRIKMARAIVEFINSVPDIPEQDYKQHFDVAFGYLTHMLFSKTTVAKLRQQSVQVAIALYQDCKYPDMYKKHTEYPYLRCADADGFYDYLCSINKFEKTIYVKLFKKIPLLTIQNSIDRKKIRFLGIPCIYIYEQR